MATVVGRGERARKGPQARRKGSDGTNGRPSEDDIRLLAYRLYERRCEAGIAGDAEADWMQAERELSRGRSARHDS
jgi:hypothetical protein